MKDVVLLSKLMRLAEAADKHHDECCYCCADEYLESHLEGLQTLTDCPVDGCRARTVRWQWEPEPDDRRCYLCRSAGRR